MIDGEVRHVTLTKAAPTLTVPAGFTWELLAGALSLTTDATVGNRSLDVKIKDGSTGLVWLSDIVDVPASQTVIVQMGPKFDPAEGTNLDAYLELNHPIPMAPAWTISGTGTGMVAGDAWSAEFIVVQKAITP